MRPCAFGVSLMDEAANPEAGWKFIQWMTEPETQVEWYKTATVLPSSQSAWEDEVLAGDEKLVAYGEQLESTQARRPCRRGRRCPPLATASWSRSTRASCRSMKD